MRRDTEVGVARGSERQTKSEPLYVEHDSHTADEAMVLGHPGGCHGGGHVGKRR
ncbi:MAG: hypothetical protein V9F03_02070 [Microthrixaceae bacterium]